MSLINFSGIASGIDSNSLIDATSEAARQARVKPNQDKVSNLEETNTAFDELKTKMGSLQSLLRTITSGLGGGAVSKTATSSKESVLTASAVNAATNGSYSITVNALAKNHVLSFNNGTGYPASTTPIQSSITGAEPVADRTVTFQIGTGANQETVSFEVTSATYSAAQFVDQFNTLSTKAEASLVNTGTASSPSYSIVLTSNYEGIEKGQISASYGAALTNLSNVANQSESAATNSNFTITGIGTITRPTNTVADVLPGVTLSLVSTGTGVVKISEDAATTQAKVQEIIDSYNEIVKFIAENNLVTREENGADVKNTFAPLASTSTDDGALTALRTQISSAQATGGSLVRIFADIGITTERDGTLKFDTTKFQTAIAAEPTSVNSVLSSFADATALTGGTIDLYIGFNRMIDISVNGNKSLISNLNDRIATAEAQIQKQADDMRARFARLESLMGKLQQQQSSLTSALAGLG